MNPAVDQELQTFLIEAELINQKVKALASNQLSPEQFDKLQAARSEDKRKRQQYKLKKEHQARQKIRQGRQGKGIHKDFASFCRFCHWEYELQTPECLRCKKPTMTLAQRREQLEQMVDVYKKNKKSREERKMKWEMWQKTKSMLWKKTSNKYDKWDYFVSDSQQQPEQEPIVPKNDPNFKALELDIEERKLNRQRDTEKAKKLKEKGNAQMKQGNYIKAIQFYHLALEHIKDIKSIYTNRALAYLKIGKYDKAIKDCTNVIEYIEVFGKSGESLDLLFKAHLRRASAYKQKKQYKEGLEDTIKALQIYPKDSSAQILKREIQSFIEHTQKVAKILREENEKSKKQEKVEQATMQKAEADKNEKINLASQEEAEAVQKDIIKQIAEAQIKEEIEKEEQEKKIEQKEKIENEKKYQSEIEQIRDLVENMAPQHIERLFSLVRAKEQNLAIFIAAKGIKKCLHLLVHSEQSHKEGFLVSYCLRGDGVAEQQVWEFGVEKIHAKINQILSSPNQMSMGTYFFLEDIFEVLVPMSLHQKYRPMLSGSANTASFFQTTFSRLITKHKKHPDLLSSFLIYGGNLCSGNSKLRDTVISPPIFGLLIGTLFDKIVSRKTSNRSYLNLKKNVYGFYANLIINENHRKAFCDYFRQVQTDKEVKIQRWDELIKELRSYPRNSQNFNQYIEALLSVFVNASLGMNLCIPQLTQCISSRYLSNPSVYTPETLNRCLLILTRLKHTSIQEYSSILTSLRKNLKVFTQFKQQKIMQQIVRLLNIVYSPLSQQDAKTGKRIFTEPLPLPLLELLKGYISSTDYGQMLFCNTCNLFGVIIDSVNVDNEGEKNKSLILKNVKENMKFLIEVAKEKVGNWRKNASILLAKMSMNPQCREQLDKHHGMDVLRSISQHVKSQ